MPSENCFRRHFYPSANHLHPHKPLKIRYNRPQFDFSTPFLKWHKKSNPSKA
ncbi:predicted protein [Neisseria gonorrhoeae SK-93-1035]|uniref:Uncharacterized protein n=2 Tax=Neisseria gonorrhoeae TaxID=485 RepID=B4RKD5_NEIG2|nr:Hypothetical protein NGK_0595 [Neisseria gonorrhoeae NCCP11945]EEZ58903.1 predicted protein [Neisseria gonorrhoeae SK-93-1035]